MGAFWASGHPLARPRFANSSVHVFYPGSRHPQRLPPMSTRPLPLAGLTRPPIPLLRGAIPRYAQEAGTR